MIYEGNIVFDDRGYVRFFNDFSPQELCIKRMYMISNYSPGFVRAWHGHNNGGQFALVTRGAAIIAAAPISMFEEIVHTGKENIHIGKYPIIREVCDHRKPKIVFIPRGFANGAKTILPETEILYMSGLSLEQAKADDIRFDSSILRSVWEIKER